MAETVKIVLENCVNNICRPGQTLTGRVECFFKKKEKVRGIRIRFKGKAQTEFNMNLLKDSVQYEGKVVYFDQQFNLVPGDNFYLEAGKHSYPFSYILPCTLPSSFEIDEGGEGTIEYTIKVTIDRPWKLDFEDKLVLNVVEPIDLNLVPALKNPRFVLVGGEAGLFAKDPVNLRVTIPYAGFVEGQTVKVTVSVINMSSVTAQFVKFKLMQDAKLRGVSRIYMGGCKDVARVISEWQCNGVGEAHTEKALTTKLTIPRKPLPNLRACSIIDVAYRLETKLVMPFPHSDIVASISVTMGTIPLSDIEGSPQTSCNPLHYNTSIATPFSGSSSPYGPMGKTDRSVSAPPEIGFNMGLLPHCGSPQLNAGRRSTLPSAPPPYPLDANLQQTSRHTLGR